MGESTTVSIKREQNNWASMMEKWAKAPNYKLEFTDSNLLRSE